MAHWKRWRRWGDPLGTRFKPVEQRFWEKVDKTETCWIWTAGVSGFGYGRFSVTYNGIKQPHHAHRWAYEWGHGPIPDGFQVDHLCKNTRCVNPVHLEAVTPAENVLRGDGPAAKNARKTHCINGHSLSGDNLIVCKRRGWRACRTCKVAWTRKWRAQRKANVG